MGFGLKNRCTSTVWPNKSCLLRCRRLCPLLLWQVNGGRMKTEIDAAVNWWGRNTRSDDLDEAQLDAFRSELNRLITNHCLGHWYPDEPMRGSGYRSLMNDIKVDAKLVAAGVKAGIADIGDRVPLNMVMWINPGEQVAFSKAVMFVVPLARPLLVRHSAPLPEARSQIPCPALPRSWFRTHPTPLPPILTFLVPSRPLARSSQGARGGRCGSSNNPLEV